MNAAPVPKISRSRHFSLVWVVPILAFLIGGWLIYRTWRSHGPEIQIDFADGSGVEPGKTVLQHLGVAVGLVKTVTVKKDFSGVSITLQLDRSASALAVDGSNFWLVHPEIGFAGVRGLDTLVTGVRLGVRPGRGGPQTHFRGLEKAPAFENPNPGRAFVLRCEERGALEEGAPVNYREVKVGVVENVTLADDASSVLVGVRVDAPYADLVRTNTQFWNAGGVSFHVGLLGAEVKSTSLDALVSGAIGFATPEGKEMGPPAAEGAHFPLHRETDKAWLKWQPKIPLKSATEQR